MFGRCGRHHENDEQAIIAWMSGRRGRPHGHDHQGRGPFGRGPFGGGHDGEEDFRVGRMLMQNDLRLLALALIAQAPRHGYDLIKRIEELTEGWYAPSPGVVYPTLTFLDEAGYVTAEPEGNKKLYTITEAGQAHLAENQALADAILSRLAGIGARASRFRGERETRGRERNEPQLPRGVDAALLNLRDVLVRRLASDPAAATDLVELLVKAAREAEQR